MNHSFTFTVDGESLVTNEHELTANQILQLAEIDPGTHYLIEIHSDHHQVSFQNDGGSIIHIHEHMRFVSVSTVPTTVS